MSLAEVVVTTAIFAVIFIVALMMYDQGNKIFKTSVESADMQQNTRAGFDRLVSDVRMAGFDFDRDGVPNRSAAGPWQPLTIYAPGAIVSPTVANGYSYRAASGGQSGSLEPAWNTTAGTATSGDGSVTWVTLGPVYQQPDEQIEFAGVSAVTVRANFDYERDIRTTEHGRERDDEPAGGQFPIVTTANDEIVTYALRSDNGPNPDTLHFWADVTEPRSAFPGPGGVAESDVQIPNVDLCTAGCNNPPYTLMRFTLQSNGAPDAGTAVANNIRGLRFYYYTDIAGTTLLTDDDGTALTQGAIGGDGRFNPANVGGTANWGDRAQRASIETIKVELVGMNSQPDKKYTNPTETLAAFRGYRTYTLQSNVSPRNLGLSGLSEPETRVPSPPVVTSVCVGACRVTRVQWNPSVTGNVDSYEVRYGTTVPPPLTLNAGYGSVGIVVPGDVVSAPVFNLIPGTPYYFKVVAVNEIGRTESTNYLSGTPVNSTRPGPVTTLTATDGAAAEANQISLSWTAPERNDPALANMSCQGTVVSGALIDAAEPIRYRVWRGTTQGFNPKASPSEGEIVLESTVPSQPNGPGGTVITWTDDQFNSRTKPPANCKDYYYRIQVYDTCSLDATGNNPNNASTGQSEIFPRAVSGGTDPAIHGYASSTTKPSAPGAPSIDFTNGNSTCDNSTNLCDVRILWPPVTTDTSNPTQMITADQYRIRRERKKATDTTWVADTVLPVLINASSDPTNMDGPNVVYYDRTALDKDPNDRRKWYYRYTITALQCGAESDPSPAVEFPASCGLANSTVIQSGASAGDGSLASPWVMAANDSIQVIPPASVDLDLVVFEVYPEPDPSPSNPPLDRFKSNSDPFVYTWSNQSDGQVYRVVITMTNAQGCTEQTERFIQDDPINCPSATVSQTGSSSGSGQGTSGLPWVMDAGDTITVNPPANGPIKNVVFTLLKVPGSSVVDGPLTVGPALPLRYVWSNQTDNETYRLNMVITYDDGCTEDIDRFITDEPPPVCTGASASVSGASSGNGLVATPWVLNGGDRITINPPVGGIVNQVVFNITPITPAGPALPPSTDSTAPYTLTWSDRTDNTIYRVDAVITYAPGCSETVTRYVRDEVCSGATVTPVGSAGAGSGRTTASPWVFNAGDVMTVTPPAGTTVTDVQLDIFNEPGTSRIGGSTQFITPYTFNWTDRTDNALYRLEFTATYSAGCSEKIIRYVRDQGDCFITATVTSLTTVDSGARKIATITYAITNPSAEIITLRGIKVSWLRDAAHPTAVLTDIVYNGSTTQSVVNQIPPTTGVMTPITPAPGTVPASSSSYTIALKYDIGKKTDVGVLAANWVTGLCLQYTVPSFGGSTASCNVFGSTSGNPGTCN
jgi:hypothetical protein